MTPRTRDTSEANAPNTTAQRLGRIVKAARDIMRKDKGLNGDLDRLPMLTWIMFLKFLDDMERVREMEAELGEGRFIPVIDAPYRWRDWASADDGLTGDALITFVNSERSPLPSGGEGPGLFAYLRQLVGADGGDRRDVVATVFRGTLNRMINGYLLRDVINKVDEIHFESSDEIHTLGTMYESMLREMRDAAGDSGEFYTPRPVVQFMVRALDPQIDDRVLDPACGTGGFLVEAYVHKLAQAKTVEDQALVGRTIQGGEAKPLPFLLAQMNLLLHGAENPAISTGNSLAVRITEIGERDRVDVVLTNPPFGGEEEAGIRDNFPADRQTSETALLFLQLVMRRLRRSPEHGRAPARAGVVVPNGTLFADGVAARIKQELLLDFELHTIVRLPPGVFSPYTGIPTNILFFERSGRATERVWFYELPLPVDRKQYTKTAPLRFEDFGACLTWWRDRRETAHAWSVPATTILSENCNLDRSNPSAGASVEQTAPSIVIARVIDDERRVLGLLEEIRDLIAELETDS